MNNKRLNSREVSQNEVGITEEQNKSIGTGPLKRQKNCPERVLSPLMKPLPLFKAI